MIGTEIISIGDELLIGQVINTNSSWIAQKLNEAGIRVNQVTTIADDQKQILTTLEQAVGRSEVILITGGLGPTKDDITKQTLCKFFNTNLIYSEKVFSRIRELFRQRGIPTKRLHQSIAEIPENCTPILNDNGTAPGMWFEKEGKIVVSMPGVPYEMKPMVTDFIIPELRKKYKTGAIIHKTFLTQGIPESVLAEKIEIWEDNLPSGLKLAYLPQPGMVRLRLSAYGESREHLEKLVAEESEKLQALLPGEIISQEADQLEEIVGELLRDRKQTLSTAESCTGGYIAHLITSIPGSSDYFKGTIVAYANEIKEKILGVSHDSLVDNGAVSEAVVREMAEGARKRLGTEYAVAVSGIAGPSGGTEEKPVGTTWIAVASPERTIANVFRLDVHRERNIRRAALTALNMLRKEIISEEQ